MLLPENNARQKWDIAWQWLCQRRRKSTPDADIWDIWFHWSHEQDVLFERVINGQYHLSPMLIHRRRDTGEAFAQWSARDALVLKWVSLMIQGHIPVSSHCVHVAGRRGGRDSLRDIAAYLRNGARYVYRTDIRGYYRHINRKQVYHQVCRYIPDPVLQDLIYQYLHYSVEDGGEFHTPESGISRSCALSPYLGATLLRYVDRFFAQEEGVMYVRYMDDFLFLSERRWPLRRTRARLLEFMDTAGFELHPDKTQVGRISRGFDWLGVWFTDAGATGIAPRASENHRLRRQRLEEQSRSWGFTEEATAERVLRYERRWSIWAVGQLHAATGGLP